MHHKYTVFVPSRGFLFFYNIAEIGSRFPLFVFVPSRGFLFFYESMKRKAEQKYSFRPLTGISLFLLLTMIESLMKSPFSSPHGDFSFSIAVSIYSHPCVMVFVPSRGFLFFYEEITSLKRPDCRSFSSPHGDFSFSITM